MTLKNQIKNLVKPRSRDEEPRRQELILNILLWLSTLGFVTLNIIHLIDFFRGARNRSLPLIYIFLILVFFIFLLWLSKKGKVKTASWLLIAVYSLPTFYSFITWGADLPAALILAVLIIVLTGVLIGGNLVLISTMVINIFLIILTYFQSAGIISVDDYWRKELPELRDAVVNAVLFSIIMVITWIFCQEIKKTLARARRSEADLRQERDSLEIKVAQRTKQLRQAETEKITQLYRLAEFGRLSSGIFHDLINPLTAVSLNLEQFRGGEKNKITDAKSYLGQALLATRKMEGLIACIKKQIRQESDPTIFAAGEEIRQIIQILAYKTRRANIKIKFSGDDGIKLYGEAIKFGQIVSNLLANAIEASKDHEKSNDKEIKIGLKRQDDIAVMTVSDNGDGIPAENLTKIFEPFFSTKIVPSTDGGGLGIGLASIKNITEKDFQGKIFVASRLNQGTIFAVCFPLLDN